MSANQSAGVYSKLSAPPVIGPSQLARGLRRIQTNVIGMMVPDITNPFFPAVVRGAEDQAFSNGCRMILCNTDNNHSNELAHLDEPRICLRNGGSLTEASVKRYCCSPGRVTGLLSVVVALEAHCLTDCRIVFWTSLPQLSWRTCEVRPETTWFDDGDLDAEGPSAFVSVSE